MFIIEALLNRGDVNEAISRHENNPELGWLIDAISNRQTAALPHSPEPTKLDRAKAANDTDMGQSRG